MSVLQKKKKIDINLQSSGTFLNLNKAKFISIGKSLKINNMNIKKIEHNISEDTFHNDSVTRQTESSSKDEIIRALKDRLTVLEKKVEKLEINNKESILKKNFLNLSHGNDIIPNKDLKLNIRVYKNKNNNSMNTLNLSKSEIYKTDDNYKSYLYKNPKSIISNTSSKYENFTIIPKQSTKKKIFIDLLKRKLIRFETVDKEKVENIKENKFKLNEIKTQNFNETKKNFLLLKRYSRKNTCDINKTNHMKLESNFHNKNNSFNDFKKKLENIKNRTKKLLRFYAHNKIANIA